MKIDKERIQNYLQDIKYRTNEIEKLTAQYSDNEIISQVWILRGLKYLLIEVAEIMANTLIHILAKSIGIGVSGYIETILKAGESKIISKNLIDKLKPIFDFRNSLVHRYWTVSDEALLSLVRKNHRLFLEFIDEVEKYIKKISKKR